MSQSSHGEAPVYLGPKAGKPVQKPGDFIFLREAAFPVRVIVDGDPVTMEAGEKRRFDRSLDKPDMPAFDTFEIENTVDVAQRVVFVVGSGDYEKIIVAGELSVAAYVSTLGRGQSAELPAAISKVITLADPKPFSVVAEGLKASSAQINTGAEGLILDGFWWGGKAYTVTPNKVIEIDPLGIIGQAPVEYALNSADVGQTWNDQVEACAVTSGGTVIFKNGGALYSMQMGEWYARRLTGDNTFQRNFTTHGGFITPDNNYFVFADGEQSNPASCNVYKYDLRDGTFSAIPGLNAAFTAGLKNVYTFDGGQTLSMSNNLGSIHHRYTLDGEFLESQEEWNTSLLSSSGSIIYSEELPFAIKFVNNEYIDIVWTESFDFYGRIEIADIGEPQSAVSVYLLQPVEYAWRGGEITMRGPVIEPIVRGIVGAELPEYLDYVNAFDHTDGRTRREIGTGTRTFAGRGVSDNFTIQDGSEFTLGLLPAAFDQ